MKFRHMGIVEMWQVLTSLTSAVIIWLITQLSKKEKEIKTLNKEVIRMSKENAEMYKELHTADVKSRNELSNAIGRLSKATENNSTLIQSKWT